MSKKRIGQATIRFDSLPRIVSFASVVGPKEGQGPFANTFDIVNKDMAFAQKTWEKSESAMQQMALKKALDKSKLSLKQLDYMFAGDLLNQCIGSAFAHRDTDVPFFGIYGACSSMAESLILAAMSVDGGYASRTAAVVSSHFCTAERQYRFPLAYGGQRTPTAQWTVTGSGAAIVAESKTGVAITHACTGKIVDMGVTDVNHMGGAMAPAAFDTLCTFFKDTNSSPSEYDLIATGDLGYVGGEILCELMKREELELPPKIYRDCGVAIFDRNKQDVHAGGSGCGCSASILCGDILNQMQQGKLKKVLFAATGALLSPTSVQQNESIPSICHLVALQSQENTIWNI